MNLQLESTVRQQDQVIKMNADVSEQLLNQIEVNKLQEAQKKALQKELMSASRSMERLQEQLYEAKKAAIEVLEHLKQQEEENEKLKQYIIELKQRMAVYLPVKDDPVDTKLAEFINNYPERQRLKIMFLRESEGVY